MHWPVRYADLRRPRITLGEHRFAMAELKQRGIRFTDEQLIFETIEAQRHLLEAASSATKSARRQVERRSRSLAAAEREMESHAVIGEGETELARLPLLAVEEWS